MKSAATIARRRLANQYLTNPILATPAEVVGALGGVQAQDYPGAKWAVAQRMKNAQDATVEEAFTQGTILRTHVLRPTWHFVTQADIRWMLALTAPRVKAAMAYHNRMLELDEKVFRRSNRVLERALRGGNQLTRAELSSVLARSGIAVGGSQRLGQLLMEAELDAIICSGARSGKQFTYALLDERAPPTPAVHRDEALFRLTKTYFTTRGPATAQDFAWWSGLTVTEARRGAQLAATDLHQETIEGQTYWSSGSVTTVRKARPLAHLLPNYDEYFIGFKDRSAIGQRFKASGVTALDSVYAHVVVVDGQLVGGWRRALNRDGAVVKLNLVIPLSGPEQKAVTAAARKYGAFLDLPVETRG